MVALYTARIFDFFIEHLWSGLWSSCFSVLAFGYHPFRVPSPLVWSCSLTTCFSCILFQFVKACESSRSFRIRTTNNSLSTTSSPVTASSSSSSGSTPAPLVNTPASPPSETVSLPDNNSLAQAITRAFAESLPSVLSSLQDFGRNTNIAATSGSFILALNSPQSPASSSSVTPCSISQSSGTLVVPSFISTYSSDIRQSFGGLYSSRHVHRKLARSGWGLLWWHTHICVLHVSKPQQSICGGSWLCSSPI